MTKKELIFDWGKSESSGKDKLFSVVIVGILFAFFMGIVELRLPSQPAVNIGEGTLIRLVDAEMARTWALVAEENGPFPGRLETGDELAGTMLSDAAILSGWTDYQVELRPLRQETGVSRAEITPKGQRVFPPITSGASVVTPAEASVRRVPILIPYDASAQGWIPEQLPGFEMPAEAEVTPDSLRFALSLREDGSVAEAIPMGGTDPVQTALESWLRSVRFAQGEGERWFGLRVDFINRRDDDAGTE